MKLSEKARQRNYILKRYRQVTLAHYINHFKRQYGFKNVLPERAFSVTRNYYISELAKAFGKKWVNEKLGSISDSYYREAKRKVDKLKPKSWLNETVTSSYNRPAPWKYDDEGKLKDPLKNYKYKGRTFSLTKPSVYARRLKQKLEDEEWEEALQKAMASIPKPKTQPEYSDDDLDAEVMEIGGSATTIPKRMASPLEAGLAKAAKLGVVADDILNAINTPLPPEINGL